MKTGKIYDNSNDDKSRNDFVITLVILENKIINFGGTCKRCHFDKVRIRTLQNGDIRVFCPCCKSNEVVIPIKNWIENFGSFIPPKE